MSNSENQDVLTHWRALWNNLWLFNWSIFFSFCMACLSLTLPVFMLLVYDRVLNARSQETLVVLCLLALGAIIAMGILDFVRRRLLARFGARLQEQLEDDLLPIQPSHRTHAPGLAEGTKDLDRLRSFIHSGALRHIIDVAWLPIFVAAVFLLSPEIGWLAVVGLIAIGCVYAFGWVISSHRLREVRHTTRDAKKNYNAATRAAQWLQGLGFGAAAKKQLIASRDAARSTVISAADRTTAIDVTLTTLRWIMSVLVLTVGAGLVLANQMTIGGMVASVILMNRLYFPFVAFLKSLPNLKDAISDWQAIGRRLQDVKRADGTKNRVLNPESPLLELRDVEVSGDLDEQPPIVSATLAIERGEIVQITGDFGAGKTLLSEAMVGMRKPCRGLVLAGGIRLSALSREDLGLHIGYVPERLAFLKGTIAANISGLAEHGCSDRVERAAIGASLHQRLMCLPLGYATQIDEMGHPLSRSDLHLLALARAIYSGPSLLVIDEPAKALVSAFAAEGEDALKRFIGSGGSVVLIGRHLLELNVPCRHYHLDRGILKQQPEMPQKTITPVVAARMAAQ
ncbi:ATP-binding cassette domain-containing protein [Cognatiyoonia sp. IB215182]|uniref:ATP-binding cassette domain-containing protein n=1 Tax=Cognatiyoonia sp. IB215182 TaxID=3097353 RepID=UPI002A12215C|nr:ATP-binding cassette domain-containing protein [Cognatiyoonia sp. IB215182]MDX8352561.1 ATP-binding cassette domain-containing protein [Cognatiyoonia sp. IB215182]